MSTYYTGEVRMIVAGKIPAQRSAEARTTPAGAVPVEGTPS